MKMPNKADGCRDSQRIAFVRRYDCYYILERAALLDEAGVAAAAAVEGRLQEYVHGRAGLSSFLCVREASEAA